MLFYILIVYIVNCILCDTLTGCDCVECEYYEDLESIISIFSQKGVPYDPRTDCDCNFEIKVKVTVPDISWSIEINNVYEVKNELWVISTLSKQTEIELISNPYPESSIKHSKFALLLVTYAETSIKLDINIGDIQIKHFIIGKTWNWENDIDELNYIFIKSIKYRAL